LAWDIEARSLDTLLEVEFVMKQVELRLGPPGQTSGNAKPKVEICFQLTLFAGINVAIGPRNWSYTAYSLTYSALAAKSNRPDHRKFITPSNTPP
jgi:hypothetical protein